MRAKERAPLVRQVVLVVAFVALVVVGVLTVVVPELQNEGQEPTMSVSAPTNRHRN